MLRDIITYHYIATYSNTSKIANGFSHQLFSRDALFCIFDRILKTPLSFLKKEVNKLVCYSPVYTCAWTNPQKIADLSTFIKYRSWQTLFLCSVPVWQSLAHQDFNAEIALVDWQKLFCKIWNILTSS